MRFAASWAAALVLALQYPLPAFAQRSPIASVKPLPPDLTPRLDPRQCGHFRGHFGPMDFRTAHPHDRRVVEEFHFDMEIRTFLAGQLSGRNMAGTSEVVWGFLYTLRSFPNHPTALLALDQLGRRLRSESPQGIDFPVECWFMRAFMIAPDDPTVRALYGAYLAHRGRTEEAIMNLQIGEKSTRQSAAVQHQIGLAWVHLKQWERAQRVAMRLKKLGFQLDVVAREVEKAKRWDSSIVLGEHDLIEGADSAEVAASASKE
jgi:hypothetical protein